MAPSHSGHWNKKRGQATYLAGFKSRNPGDGVKPLSDFTSYSCFFSPRRDDGQLRRRGISTVHPHSLSLLRKTGRPANTPSKLARTPTSRQGRSLAATWSCTPEPPPEPEVLCPPNHSSICNLPVSRRAADSFKGRCISHLTLLTRSPLSSSLPQFP